MKTRSRSRGFTLPELLITLGVIAIILSLAVPSVSSIVKDNRLAAKINAVVSDLHLARSEAVKRDVRVILCRSADPNLAVPTCGGNDRDWTTGYLVFTGEDGNNTYQAGTDTLLGRGQPAPQGIQLHNSSSWNNNLEINPNGSLNEGGIAIMALCDDRKEAHGRQITIRLTGMPKMSSGPIDNCSPTG